MKYYLASKKNKTLIRVVQLDKMGEFHTKSLTKCDVHKSTVRMLNSIPHLI
jgi:hypothetical protein